MFGVSRSPPWKLIMGFKAKKKHGSKEGGQEIIILTQTTTSNMERKTELKKKM